MLRYLLAIGFVAYSANAWARFESPWAGEIQTKCRIAERHALAARDLPVTGPHVAAGVFKACGSSDGLVKLQKDNSSGVWLTKQADNLIEGLRKKK